MKNFKRIPFENLDNCRDLGGYGCADGGFFRYHKLYRADAPNRMNQQEWQQMWDMNVRTIIDLRSESERTFMPYQVPQGIEVLHMPLMTGEVDMKNLQESAMEAFGKSLSEGYISMVENGAERVVQVLNTIGQQLETGAVLYHCSAGKDRTGVISALLYLLCGVEEEDIIADYQVTETYGAKKSMSLQIPEAMKHCLNSDPANMRTLLDRIREKQILEGLFQEGLMEENVEKIRSEVIEF